LASFPQSKTETKPEPDDDSEPPANQGKLIADATCAPADIRYPTDTSLLNEAREKTDELIDQLHTPLVGRIPRPRTYRVRARRCFVAFTKNKKPGRKKIRRAKREQLGFLRRNFKAIDRLLDNLEALTLSKLSHRQYKKLFLTGWRTLPLRLLFLRLS
jgi:IS5 family transposase